MKSTDKSRDLYEVLNVSPQAKPEEIKRAFRTGALRWHPDRNPGDEAAEERFKRINEAYRVLGEERSRRLYDLHLADGRSPRGFSSRAGRSDGTFGRHQDPFTPRGRWRTDLGGCRRARAGGCRRRRYASSRAGLFGDFAELFGARSFLGLAEDVILELSPQEAAGGCERTVYVQHGSHRSAFLLSIPAGVEEGTLLRVVTEGPQGGEIFLRVQIR